jgi:ubiquinone/menaquinone biosynthesis C-methylase UbiE
MDHERVTRATRHTKTPEEAYRPFPNVQWRNGMQALVEIPLLTRLLRLPTGVRTLEVGCGRGIALPKFAELCRPARLVGLDIDGTLVAEARAHVESLSVEAELCQADVRAIPFADESFDMVVDFGTCYHISDPERALQEIARCLTEGGLFVHETPIGQLLAHPTSRSSRVLPWAEVPHLRRRKTAVLWSYRTKV